MKIDLHGCHTHEGWRKFKREIDEAYYTNHKKCVVVTGQGAMMYEFPTWAHLHPLIVEYTQAPHNPGSFTVKLKKRG